MSYNEILAKHIHWDVYIHQWYRETLIFLGTYHSNNLGITFDLYFGYEIQNKELDESEPGYYSNKPIGIAVFGKNDRDIFESSLMTATHQYPQKEIFDIIRMRAVYMNLIDERYNHFNVSLEQTKIIILKQAGWKQTNKASDGSRIWVLSENTTVDTDTAFDMLILSKIKQNQL